MCVFLYMASVHIVLLFQFHTASQFPYRSRSISTSAGFRHYDFDFLRNSSALLIKETCSKNLKTSWHCLPWIPILELTYITGEKMCFCLVYCLSLLVFKLFESLWVFGRKVWSPQTCFICIYFITFRSQRARSSGALKKQSGKFPGLKNV